MGNGPAVIDGGPPHTFWEGNDVMVLVQARRLGRGFAVGADTFGLAPLGYAAEARGVGSDAWGAA